METHSFSRVSGDSFETLWKRAFLQISRTRKLGEIVIFYTVMIRISMALWILRYQSEKIIEFLSYDYFEKTAHVSLSSVLEWLKTYLLVETTRWPPDSSVMLYWCYKLSCIEQSQLIYWETCYQVGHILDLHSGYTVSEKSGRSVRYFKPSRPSTLELFWKNC